MCQGAVIIPYFVIIYFKSIEFRYRNPSFNLTSCVRFLLCKCIAKAIEKRIQLKFEYFPFWMAFLIVSILLFSIFSSLAIDNISYLSTSAIQCSFHVKHYGARSLFAFKFPFLWCCSFSFNSFYIEKTIPNNKVIEFGEMSFDTIFQHISTFQCDRMQSLWTLLVSLIYLCILFMSFCCCCCCSCLRFAAFYVVSPSPSSTPPTMVTNFFFLFECCRYQWRCLFHAKYIHCAWVLFDYNKIKIWNHLHKFFLPSQ